jgi:hypothetical protein
VEQTPKFAALSGLIPWLPNRCGDDADAASRRRHLKAELLGISSTQLNLAQSA